MHSLRAVSPASDRAIAGFVPFFPSRIRSTHSQISLSSRAIVSVLLLIGVLLLLPPETRAFAPVRWDACLRQATAWYGSGEARMIAGIVLQYQHKSGGWPKRVDMTTPPTGEMIEALASNKSELLPTIDNNASTTQIRYLARVYGAQQDTALLQSLLRGVEYLLASQYPNGGWPQFYPLRKGYYSHITFNDNAMVNVLEVLDDIAKGSKEMSFAPAGLRARAAGAVRKGVACILDCQVRVSGDLTAWCQQHDERTLRPAPARAYELISLSGSETVGILGFLMRIEKPGPRIVESVESAVRWLNTVALRRVRIEATGEGRSWKERKRAVVADPFAPPLWARFYEIGTNRPFVADRDGQIRYSLAGLSVERRNNYAWFGTWASDLLKEDYPRWVRTSVNAGQRPEDADSSHPRSLPVRVCLDTYFNNEWRTAKDGSLERYHYTWEDTTNSGFSQLGAVIDGLGAERSSLPVAPTLETLGQCDVFIIVDPDLPGESPEPHTMDPGSVRVLRAWVEAGGVLVLMANDSVNANNAELTRLSREFGIVFNADLHHRIPGREYGKGAITSFPSHPMFSGVHKIFLKEVCSLALTPPAHAVLEEHGVILMAEARFGRGMVFAVGDPWLYNEYMDHRRLPEDFDNDAAAASLFGWLFRAAQ